MSYLKMAQEGGVLVGELSLAQNELNGAKTTHLLHLFLSIITSGVWIIVWILCVVKTSMVRDGLERKIKKLNIELVEIEYKKALCASVGDTPWQ